MCQEQELLIYIVEWNTNAGLYNLDISLNLHFREAFPIKYLQAQIFVQTRNGRVSLHEIRCTVTIYSI
jgi:hypothetical protein